MTTTTKTPLTYEAQLLSVAKHQMARLAATALSAAEYDAKAAAVQRWVTYQLSYGKQLYAGAL